MVDEPLRPHRRSQEVWWLLGVEERNDDRTVKVLLPEPCRDLECDCYGRCVVIGTRIVVQAGVVMRANQHIPVAATGDANQEVRSADVWDWLVETLITRGFQTKLLQAIPQIGARGEAAVCARVTWQTGRRTQKLNQLSHGHLLDPLIASRRIHRS